MSDRRLAGKAELPEMARYTEADTRRFYALFTELLIERVEAAIREHRAAHGAELREMK